MHVQNREWLIEALSMLGRPVGLCVEVGSRHLDPSNPSDPRPIVRASAYVGVDAYPGPGVDVVGLGADYTPPGPVDLAVTLVALEHDPDWQSTVLAMAGWLAPGGVLCITCAGPGCFAHEEEHSPTPGHYGNVSSDQILEVLRPIGGRTQVGDVDCTTVRGVGGSLVPTTWTRTRVLLAR